ncbi:MAG: SCO family protein [Flavobacteriaceae bacterium]
MNARLRPLLPAIVLLVIGVLALGISWYSVVNAPENAPASSIQGNFSLTDDTGKRVTEADFAGRPHLVFFGFTHCPDVCPTTLYELSAIFEELGDDADKLDVLFISVDPERDTPESMADYVGSFGPQFTGLTGTKEEIDAVARNFKVYYRKVPLEGGDYTIDHTAVVYMFNRKGEFVAPFNAKRPPEEAAAELRKLL